MEDRAVEKTKNKVKNAERINVEKRVTAPHVRVGSTKEKARKKKQEKRGPSSSPSQGRTSSRVHVELCRREAEDRRLHRHQAPDEDGGRGRGRLRPALVAAEEAGKRQGGRPRGGAHAAATERSNDGDIAQGLSYCKIGVRNRGKARAGQRGWKTVMRACRPALRVPALPPRAHVGSHWKSSKTLLGGK